MKIIRQAAEAIIYRHGNEVIKERIKKSYRIDDIDLKLRKSRTRKEAKLLEKVENAPKVLGADEKRMKIRMEFIDGKLVKNVLDGMDKKRRSLILREIGGKIARMHDNDIIHGDLTTSNMIYVSDNSQTLKGKRGDNNSQEKEVISGSNFLGRVGGN